MDRAAVLRVPWYSPGGCLIYRFKRLFRIAILELIHKGTWIKIGPSLFFCHGRLPAGFVGLTGSFLPGLGKQAKYLKTECGHQVG